MHVDSKPQDSDKNQVFITCRYLPKYICTYYAHEAIPEVGLGLVSLSRLLISLPRVPTFVPRYY